MKVSINSWKIKFNTLWYVLGKKFQYANSTKEPTGISAQTQGNIKSLSTKDLGGKALMFDIKR